MQTTTGARIGRCGGVALLIMAGLLMQGSVRADGPLPLAERGQNYLNRVAIGLLQRGKNLVDVLDFIVQTEDCAIDRSSKSCDTFRDAAEKVGIDPNEISHGLAELSAISGFWYVYEGFTRTTGSLQIGPLSGGFGYQGKAKFSPSGTADFLFYEDSNGDYDFKYTTDNGDSGTGYLLWSPTGCALVGAFISDKLKNQSGSFNTALFVLRRC